MKRNGGGSFPLYLAGQGISNFGDSFRFIAVTVMILKMTGSGMETALGIALTTLPSLVASPFAGVLGDRINERRLLILVDFLRFLFVPFFLFAREAEQVYSLLILLSLLDLLYNPSRRKFILGLTGREGAVKANSLLTGVSGAAYLAGPVLAGILTDAYGVFPAITISAFSCLCSCLLTIGASSGYRPVARRILSFTAELGNGISYCRSAPEIKALLVIGLITGFCTISVNLSFYPYAFDVLKVTASGWSLMITVYYGTNLLAMLLVKVLGEHLEKNGGRVFYCGLCIVSVIWSLYSVVTNFTGILLLQFVEGTTIAVCGILLSARFQMITANGYMARVSGLNDILANAGKLAGMACTAVVAGKFSYGPVFLLNGAILFLLAVSGLSVSGWVHDPKRCRSAAQKRKISL